jgi:hypothetical protein
MSRGGVSRAAWLAMASALLIGGCASGGQSTGTPAGDSMVYRTGTFKKSPIDMTACTSYGMHVAEPDMHFTIGKDGDWFTVLGGPTKDETAAIWQVAIRPGDAESSEVELRNKSATTSALDEVWKVVAFCETYKAT